jgi:hypothetical protein
MGTSSDIKKAKRQVRKLKGFYIHLTCFVVVCLAVALINLKTTPNTLWFYWLPLGWSVGIVLHGISVLKLKAWEAKKVEEIMNEK